MMAISRFLIRLILGGVLIAPLGGCQKAPQAKAPPEPTPAPAVNNFATRYTDNLRSNVVKARDAAHQHNEAVESRQKMLEQLKNN